MMKGLYLLFMCAVANTGAFAQKHIALIDSLCNTYNRIDVLNGAVLVAEDNNVVYKKAFGKANFEWGINNTPGTKFKMASISKPITAVIVLQLCQGGKMNLEDKLSDYLPAYPQGDKITIYQLLTHTSGIIDTRDVKNFDNSFGMQHLTRDGLLAVFKDSALLFQPGKNFYYSSFNYNLLAIIIEKVTGKNFKDVLRERIFNTAGMINTSTIEDNEVKSGYANGYEINYAGIYNAQYFDASATVGSGSMITTVHDLFLFFKALKTGRLLNADYTKMFFTPSGTDNNGVKTGFSSWYFNLKLNDRDSTGVTYYAGGHFGVNTLVYDSYEKNKMVIVLLNVKTQRMFEMGDNILNILYNLHFDWPKDAHARLFAQDIKSYGISYAVRRFKEQKIKYGNLYTQKPRDLNRLGYYYLDNNDFYTAVEIFKLNLLYYPNEGDFYDSLGEGYMLLGDKENATTNLKKAIAIDPSNNHAKELLSKLLN